ncbi:unnamed protein product [Durusdinium trenchii]|uniref:EGF-like domain-containing protein n=2 Tax=Durusdinium trenchii TaxID=1381693 RepID=A0ABP0PDS6_9DINO
MRLHSILLALLGNPTSVRAEDGWWCAPEPGKCHGHLERLAKRASVRMAAKLAAPYVVDWDGDGVEDLLMGDHNGLVRYYSKHPNGRYYVRTGSDNPFRFIAPEKGLTNLSAASPVAVDFDQDGTLDLLLAVAGRIHYYRQSEDGTLAEVEAARSPFRNVTCSWAFCRFHAADWDADGDIDLVVPAGQGLAYLENVEGELVPRTGAENPFRYFSGGYVANHRGWDGLYSSPFMVDWDGDGDLDLLVGTAEGSVLYFERTASGRIVQLQGEQSPFQSVGTHYYPSVHAAFRSGHPRMELFIGDVDGKVTLYAREQNQHLTPQLGASNPFYALGLLTSAVPAWPLIDENKDRYLMFQEANVSSNMIGRARVQVFQELKNHSLINITTTGTPLAAIGARWLQAGEPVDVDFNKDGQVDRLTIWPDGRIAYEERNAQGVLVLKEGPESPFDGLNLDNGLADGKVTGFLPIDWNHDGNMDLLVGAWGPRHLKYFQAGWCKVKAPCSLKGICGADGYCTCMSGYTLNDCSGCRRGYFTKISPLADLVQYSCAACPGKGSDAGLCSFRGLCSDDFHAKSAYEERNRLQKSMLAGNGTCTCSTFFHGKDCSLGLCPAGYEYDDALLVAECVPCLPGFYTSLDSNQERCERCPEGSFTSERGTSACSLCRGRLLLYAANEEKTACRSNLVTNLPTFFAVLLWNLMIFLIPLACGMPFIVHDIRRTLGRDGLVRVTTNRHWILHKAVKVRFTGTGVPQLDRAGYAYRARVHTSREVELVTAKCRSPVVEAMASSSGQVQVFWRHAIAFTGVLGVPFSLWLVLLFVLYIAFLAIFWEQYERPMLACVFHLALGATIAILGHWLRWQTISQTQIIQDVQVFDRQLRRRFPRPMTCEKGPARAIEPQQLLRFLDFFRNHIGNRTTYYVVHNIILPLTEPYRLSYAEVAGPSTCHRRWFVSHYWGTDFAHLVSSVERHSQDCSTDFTEKYPYWICTFSNNQWAVSEELGDSYLESSFYQALRGKGTLGTVMVFDEEAMPLTRSWCLFELLQTVLLRGSSHDFKGLMLCSPLGTMNTGKGSLDLAMNVSNKLAKLDLEAAEASNRSDKDMIDNLVRQEGGFEQINEFLVDSISEVLHKLREQFTRNIDSLEKDLARKMNRAQIERARTQLSLQHRRSMPPPSRPLGFSISVPQMVASPSTTRASPVRVLNLPWPAMRLINVGSTP